MMGKVLRDQIPISFSPNPTLANQRVRSSSYTAVYTSKSKVKLHPTPKRKCARDHDGGRTWLFFFTNVLVCLLLLSFPPQVLKVALPVLLPPRGS